MEENQNPWVLTEIKYSGKTEKLLLLTQEEGKTYNFQQLADEKSKEILLALQNKPLIPEIIPGSDGDVMIRYPEFPITQYVTIKKSHY